MKVLQAIKTYFTLGEDAYNVIKRFQDESLQEWLVKIFSSSYYKALTSVNKSSVCKRLSIVATSDDVSEQRNFLDNVFRLINDKNLNNSTYFAHYLNLIFDNPNFDVTTAYDLEANPNMGPDEIFNVISIAAIGIPQKCYMEAKSWNEKYHSIMFIFETPAFKNLSDDMKDRFYLKLKEIRMSNEYNSTEKGIILEEVFDFFCRAPEDIDETKFLDYFNIFLNYPMLGDGVWMIMSEADDYDKTIDDVKKWIDIYAKLYINEEVGPSDFYCVVFDNKLASYGILDLIVNNIFESKLSKADLIGDIAFLLENLLFNQAVNIILALFKMPSQKHYDLVSNILSHDEVLYSNRLLDFIDKVIATPEEKLDELKREIEYEVVYQEMPFSKATIEHGSEAMDYLDSHPGTKSTSLVRIPIWQKRNKYKI